jgi:hypothetical protein
LQSATELLQNPPNLTPDLTPNEVAVAPVPLQQRTRIGTF